MLSHSPARQRRYHSPEFKASVVALCRPGVSTSAVALAHGLNANLLRRWIKQFRSDSLPVPAVKPVNTMVPISVSPVYESTGNQRIEIALAKNGAKAEIRWPVEEADSLGHWLSGWLK